MKRLKRLTAWILLNAMLLCACLPTGVADEGMEEIFDQAQGDTRKDEGTGTTQEPPPASETQKPETTPPPGNEQTQKPEESTTPAPEGETDLPEGESESSGKSELPEEEITTPPTDEPDQDPGEEATPAPEEWVEETPTPDADAQETVPPYQHMGEAWTVLGDGTVLEGGLVSVLLQMQERGERSTVYITTRRDIRVQGIPVRLVEKRITLKPDPEVFSENYEVVALVDSEDEKSFIVRVQHIGAEPVIPTPTPVPTAAPIIVFDDAVDKMLLSDEESGNRALTDEEDNVFGVAQAPTLAVSAASPYPSDEWQNVPASFSLGGLTDEHIAEGYSYGVWVGTALELIRGNAYSFSREGDYELRFVILHEGNPQGDEKAFTVKYDGTDPLGPTIESKSATSVVIWANDAVSAGDMEISLDGGETWERYDPAKGYTINGTENSKLYAGSIQVRDGAGNISKLQADYTFTLPVSKNTSISIRRSSGLGGGTKTIRHVKEASDYSLANYNALDLSFSLEPSEKLVAGGTVLPLTLTSIIDDVQDAGRFTAQLASWQVDESDARETPNTLVLTASGQSEMNTWTFTGEAYRLLYNSGIDYLVFASEDYMTAVSTAGFTAGTTYAKLKAGGVSTRKFAYTLNQDEALRETTLSVEVDGETYLLGEEEQLPMYRYDVIIGTLDMMAEPFKSYLPGYETEEDTVQMMTFSYAGTYGMED